MTFTHLVEALLVAVNEIESDYTRLMMWSFDVDLDVKSDMMMMSKLQTHQFRNERLWWRSKLSSVIVVECYLDHHLTLLHRSHVAFDDEWRLILIKLMFNNTRSHHFRAWPFTSHRSTTLTHHQASPFSVKARAMRVTHLVEALQVMASEILGDYNHLMMWSFDDDLDVKSFDDDDVEASTLSFRDEWMWWS
jgi:hypothetical protein